MTAPDPVTTVPPAEVPSHPLPPTAAGSTEHRAAESPIDLHFGTEWAVYGDSDSVYVFSPSIRADVSSPTAGWKLGGQYIVDVVSAASVDIVSTASRRYGEVRHAGSLDGGYKPDNLGVAANVSTSIEPDYQSFAGGGSVSCDLFKRNLSLLAAYYHSQDTAGRTDTSFATFSR
ncbi:MAG: hypothetical protein HOO96_42580, partial [Polyangiaceae bacterium]|nr:hypothetical protein [Polyangiaceae bacterium]